MRFNRPLLLAALICSPVLRGGEPACVTNLLKSLDQTSAWRIDQVEGGRGMVLPEGDALRFVVMMVDEEATHVQAVQGDLDLQDGRSYTVSGKIKASSPRTILLTATIDEDDWHGIGLHEELQLTPEYQPFEFHFRVSDAVRRKNRIGFVIGNQLGSIWVQDLTLKCP